MPRGPAQRHAGRSAGRTPGRGPAAGARAGVPAPQGGHEELVAQLGRALIDAARQSAVPAGLAPDGTRELARQPKRTPAELARLNAMIDRERRIAAGRCARRLPYLATTLTGVAGYGAWGAAELAQVALGPDGHAGAVAATVSLCAAGCGVARVAFRHGITARWTRRWWTAAAAASGWVSLAAAIGPDSWPMTALLASGATALSTAWLREHAVPEVADMPVLAPLPQDTERDEDLGDVLARRWITHVSGKKGPVPDALLTDRRDLPNAIQWTVQLPPGQVAFDQLLAQLPRIASGLRQGQTKVIFEPVIDDESTAYLSVITRDVLAEGVPYPGPAYLREHRNDGRIPIGPFADGTGQAHYLAVDGVGCRNGLATGAPGSGKSAFLEVVTLGHLASGCWVPLFADGDPGGGSSPLLNRIAYWAAAGPEQALAQLEALEEELEVRTALKATLTEGPDGTPVPITDPIAQLPVREMLPCPGYPGILWVLDELHRLTTDDWLKSQKFPERLERIARIGRKYGIIMLVGTQSLLIDDFGGGSVGSKLRGILSARNNFAFYNPNRSEQHVVGGLRIAPSTLPTGGGYAFSTGSGRLSVLRVAWARDLSPWTTDLPPVTPDDDTRHVMDRYRPADAGDPTVLFANAAARLRALRSGPRDGPDYGPGPRTTAPSESAGPKGVPGVGGPQPAGPDQDPARPAGPDQHVTPGPRPTVLGPVRIPTALSAANVISLRPDHGPSAVRSERPGPDSSRIAAATSADPLNDVAVPDTVHGLNQTQERVYRALLGLGDRQVARNAQLIDLTGLEAPTVAKALTALAKKELAVKVGHGAWMDARRITQRALNSENAVGDDDDEQESAG